MKSDGLVSIIQKKYTPYKQSKELVLEHNNILEQDFSMLSINQKWVSDITYMYVQREGWCYLASVMEGTQYTSQDFKNLTSELNVVLAVREALTIMLVLNRSMLL